MPPAAFAVGYAIGTALRRDSGNTVFVSASNGADDVICEAWIGADELAVKTQGGIVIRYKKSDIAKREQQKLSIMPAGLQQTMSTRDLVDLVEYLSSLKKAAR